MTDREGADLHNAEGLTTFLTEIEATLPESVQALRSPHHINDTEFAEKALEIFDGWCVDGTVQAG
ncbi:MAG: Tm-1-like ATP-binding domain-containing protein [Litoreibacter sp.]